MLVVCSVLGDRAAEFFELRYEFVINALLATSAVGLVCGVVGTFLVLRGLSLLGDAAGHATLPGVCAAFLITGAKTLPVLLTGALVSSGVSALAVTAFSRGRRVRPDAAIGIALTVSFAIGVCLLSIVQRSPAATQSGISDFLFGNAAGITRRQVVFLGATSAAILTATLVFHRALVLSVFDPNHARALGIPVRIVEGSLVVGMSLCVVVGIQCVGVVLVAAMLIIPASTGRLIANTVVGVMLSAAVVGVLSAWGGVFVSFLGEGLSTGPTMVLCAAFFFVVALLFGPQGGLLRRRATEGAIT